MPDKRKYVSPEIKQLPYLAYTKQLPHDIKLASDFGDPIDAETLVKEFGSPLYIVSERRLREDFQIFKNTFSRNEIDTVVAYSIKTNYLPAICQIFRQEGAWAEVVSGMEYELVCSLGFNPANIIFNGPHKTESELEVAILKGSLINVDSFDELSRIERLCERLDKRARIGIRISFKYFELGWTKFGFDDDAGESQQALKKIARNPDLELELLHNHCGTFVLNKDLYAKSVERLIELVKFARELNLKPSMVDVGGGFPSMNILKPEFDMPGGSTRSGDYLQSFSDEICSQLIDALELFENKPVLVLEPGRAIVDASTQILTTVVARKEKSDQPDALIVDAGVNLIPTAVYYNHPLNRVAGDESAQYGRQQTANVYGPLCMQTDLIRGEAILPPVKTGDVLAVSQVGAYCHTQSSQFIQTRPATVLIGPNGPEVIRREETWRDVFALDAIPERLIDEDVKF